MLIPLSDQYVAIAHIVQVVAHPVARDVCVVLTNKQEVRVPLRDFETKAEAVARVVRLIQEKSA